MLWQRLEQTPDTHSIRNTSILGDQRAGSNGLYHEAGNDLLEWQQLLACDIMAINEENLWVHRKYGYSVLRRKGKRPRRKA